MRLCDDGVHLHKEPIEQQVICRVKRYAKKGMSCRSIARKLNQIGQPTKERRAWTHVQIGNILGHSGNSRSVVSTSSSDRLLREPFLFHYRRVERCLFTHRLTGSCWPLYVQR